MPQPIQLPIKFEPPLERAKSIIDACGDDGGLLIDAAYLALKFARDDLVAPASRRTPQANREAFNKLFIACAALNHLMIEAASA